MTPTCRIATDVGGTFTDVVLERGDELVAFKAPTTPDDPACGVLDAVRVAAAALDVSLGDLLGACEVFVHGTTRAINAMLTGTTARTALLVTAGHPDILLFREGGRTAPFDLTIEYPDPLVPRSLTFEIPERVLADGRIHRALDEEATLEVIGRVAAADVEAVAVCLLWSVVRGDHELRVGELLADHLPGVPVTLSHELNPTLREYRRASSTAIDASLKPLMAEYITRLEARLRESGLSGQLLLVSSTGGTMTAGAAAAAPIHTLNSGPAMAPAAARDVLVRERIHATAGGNRVDTGDAVDAIVFDSGGTTCDISLVRDGHVVHTRETWIGGELSGHITGFPSVEIHSIAAGGGSIARLDDERLLQVGPDSAGAVPGPACYRRGGTEPTLTDACLVAGYLDPATFLDGSMALDPAAAAEAMSLIAEPLGVDVRAAAQAVIDLATEQMVGAIESITLGKGIDARRTPLVGGGGAAGLNIVAIARRLGSPVAVIPAFGATLSAAGGMMSPLVRDVAITHPTTTDRFDGDGLADVIRRLDAAAAAFLAEHPRAVGTVSHSVEARYSRQVWDLVVGHPGHRAFGDAEVAELAQLFHEAHERAAGISDPDSPVECLTWRVRASCARSTAHAFSDLGAARPTADVRAVSFGSDGVHEAVLVHAADLTTGAAVRGPAIVEGPATTVVVPPGAKLERTGAGHLVIDP